VRLLWFPPRALTVYMNKGVAPRGMYLSNKRQLVSILQFYVLPWISDLLQYNTPTAFHCVLSSKTTC
jgi:hypothetical protein